MKTDDIVEINQIVALYGHFMDQRNGRGRAFGRAMDAGDIFTEDVAFLFGDQVLRGNYIFKLARTLPLWHPILDRPAN